MHAENIVTEEFPGTMAGVVQLSSTLAAEHGTATPPCPDHETDTVAVADTPASPEGAEPPANEVSAEEPTIEAPSPTPPPAADAETAEVPGPQEAAEPHSHEAVADETIRQRPSPEATSVADTDTDTDAEPAEVPTATESVEPPAHEGVAEGIVMQGSSPEATSVADADTDTDVEPAEVPTATESVEPPAHEGVADEGIMHEPAPPTTAEVGAGLPDLGMPVHPACNLFPMMGEAELEKLAEDIKTNGLVNPIVMHEGQILDGRNRFLACRKADVEPRLVQWREMYTGSMSPHRWVWSANAERRHLTIDQITMIHVRLRALEEQAAGRQRQIEAGRDQGKHGNEGGRRNKKPLPAISPEGVSQPPEGVAAPSLSKPKDHSGETREKLASEIDSTGYKVQQAMKVLKQDPALAAEVTQGKKTLGEAAKEVKAKEVKAKEGKSKQVKSKRAASAGRRAGNRQKRNAQPGLSGSAFDRAGKVNELTQTVDRWLDEGTEEERNPLLKDCIEMLKSRMLKTPKLKSRK